MRKVRVNNPTAWLSAGVVVLLITWDIYVAIISPGDTISKVLLGYAQRHPVIPFLFGVIMGHLFWPQKR